MASIYGANIDTSIPASPDPQVQAAMAAELEQKAKRDASYRVVEEQRASAALAASQAESLREEDRRRASLSKELGMKQYVGTDKQLHPVVEEPGVVATRVLGSTPAGGQKKYAFDETQRFDEDPVPIAPQIPGGRVGEKILGPGEQAIADIARPVPEQGTGIRFAFGGKWYEQTGSGYVPVDQVKTDKGVQFNRTGPEASPEVMADIRQGVRSQGAFGKALPPTSGAAGGFSPSPSVSDVAVLPESAIEDIAGKTQMRGYEKVLGDLERIPDEALPPQMRGLGLTRQDVRQLMLAQASHPAREARPGVGPEALAQLQKIEEHYQSQKQAIEAAPEGQQKEEARAKLERWHADARRTATGWDEKPQLGI